MLQGTSEDARTLNSYLETISASIYAERTLCIAQRKSITAEYLRDFITGKSEDKKQLIEIFANYNSKIEELVGKKYSYKTYQRYRTTYNHSKAFIAWKYNDTDIEIKSVDYEFVTDFTHWLQNSKKL